MTTPPRALTLLRIATPSSHSSPWIVVVPRASNFARTRGTARIPRGAVTAELAAVHTSAAFGLLSKNCEFARSWDYRRHDRASFVSTSRVYSAVAAMESADLEAAPGHGEAVGAPRLVADVRAAYKSGRTKAMAWRMQQLKEIVRMVAEREEEISDALFADLGKPAHEAYIAEVG